MEIPEDKKPLAEQGELPVLPKKEMENEYPMKEQDIEDHSHPDYEEVIRSLARRVEQMEQPPDAQSDKDYFGGAKKSVESADYESPAGGPVEDKQDVQAPAAKELDDTRVKHAEIEERLRRIERILTEQTEGDSFGDAKPVVAPEVAAPEERPNMMERRRRLPIVNRGFRESLNPKQAIQAMLKGE